MAVTLHGQERLACCSHETGSSTRGRSFTLGHKDELGFPQGQLGWPLGAGAGISCTSQIRSRTHSGAPLAPKSPRTCFLTPVTQHHPSPVPPAEQGMEPCQAWFITERFHPPPSCTSPSPADSGPRRYLQPQPAQQAQERTFRGTLLPCRASFTVPKLLCSAMTIM